MQEVCKVIQFHRQFFHEAYVPTSSYVTQALAEHCKHMPKTLLKSYKEASEKTGLTVWQLIRMVEARKIRVIKPNTKTVMFYLEDLLEDIEDMVVPKLT